MIRSGPEPSSGRTRCSIGAIWTETGGSCDMAEEHLDANAAMRRYWNTVAGPRWVTSPGFRERRNQESLALLLARLSLTGGESVLEIGCGTGALTLPLAEAVGEYGRVVAVDISEPMLNAARQKIGERRFEVCLERFRLPRGRRRQKHIGKGRGWISEHVHMHVKIERCECLFAARRVAVAEQRIVAEQHHRFDRISGKGDVWSFFLPG